MEGTTTTEAPKALLVPQPLAQALVNYLQRCPYGDVHQLIGGIMQCQVVELQPAPPPTAGAA